MVHEALYRSQDIAQVDYQEYLIKLSNYLVRSVKGAAKGIEIEIDAKVDLCLDKAIPLGLLINEVVTNSINNHFEVVSSGKISIRIEALEYPNFVMQISDSGGANNESTNSLGLQLIHNLALQLRGNIEVENSLKGNHSTLYFQELKPKNT